jgi:hypothetical protein
MAAAMRPNAFCVAAGSHGVSVAEKSDAARTLASDDEISSSAMSLETEEIEEEVRSGNHPGPDQSRGETATSGGPGARHLSDRESVDHESPFSGGAEVRPR